MTPEDIALEFAEIFDELPSEQINEMLAKNIPFETIEFFSRRSLFNGRTERLPMPASDFSTRSGSTPMSIPTSST